MTQPPIQPREFTKEESIKGGKSTSPKKALAARMNGLKNAKNLTDEQRKFIALVEDKNLGGLILELLKSQLAEDTSFSRKGQILDKLLKIYEILSDTHVKKEFLLLEALKELKKDGTIRQQEFSE